MRAEPRKKRLLLDECMPQDLRLALDVHHVETARYAGLSNIVCTGTRVPANTGAPLILCGLTVISGSGNVVFDATIRQPIDEGNSQVTIGRGAMGRPT